MKKPKIKIINSPVMVALARGLFNRHVVLTTALCKNLSDKERQSIIAHEEAHHKYLHLWIDLFIYPVIVVLTGLSYPDPLLMIAVMIMGILARLAINREMEVAADKYAYNRFGEDYISALKKISADEKTIWWLHDHPPLKGRLWRLSR